jgi:hypothetical protein
MAAIESRRLARWENMIDGDVNSAVRIPRHCTRGSMGFNRHISLAFCGRKAGVEGTWDFLKRVPTPWGYRKVGI